MMKGRARPPGWHVKLWSLFKSCLNDKKQPKFLSWPTKVLNPSKGAVPCMSNNLNLCLNYLLCSCYIILRALILQCLEINIEDLAPIIGLKAQQCAHKKFQSLSNILFSWDRDIKQKLWSASGLFLWIPRWPIFVIDFARLHILVRGGWWLNFKFHQVITEPKWSNPSATAINDQNWSIKINRFSEYCF